MIWLDFWQNFAFMEYGGKCPLLYMARQRKPDYRWIIVFNVGTIDAKECNATLAREMLIRISK